MDQWLSSIHGDGEHLGGAEELPKAQGNAGAVGLSTVWMVVSLTSAYVCGRFSNRMLLCAVYSLSIILD